MTIPANETDWNQIWGQQMTQWRECAGQSCQDFWDDEESAAVYAEKHAKQNHKRVERTVTALELKPEFRVLDIGAGPGNLALPMAARVAHVTTVEPAAGMNRIMASEMARQSISNVRPVKKSWEEVCPDQDLEGLYDLVLASMSLGMADIRGAVEKMEAVCCGRVVLFWHAGIPGWEQMPRALWPTLFNAPYHGGPKSDVLFQVLYQMGIYPQIQVTRNCFSEVFPSMAAAVAFYRHRFPHIRDEHVPQVESYIREHCRKRGEEWIMDFDHASMGFSWTPRSGQRRAA